MNAALRARLASDFAVYGRDGRLSALVEAKRAFGTSSAWARTWHATVVERLAEPPEVYVVLVVPDRIYGWRPGAGASSSPDWMADATPWLEPYFARLKIPVEEVGLHVFEEIVGLWLRDVAQGELRGSGDVASATELLESLRGSEVVERAAA